jgi:pantoate--beta-alanine ligase
MKTIRTIAEVRAALAPSRRREATIGLVPTMGAFHDGHLSLVRHARTACDVVVVSLFVNPAQFNEASDLEAYPRDEQRDGAQAAELGADFLFAPPVSEIYPRGFATSVSVTGLTETLEGEQRGRSHFDGVSTVVTKLLNIVAPDVAYFGQKDFQQALVIKRLVRDLNLPVRIELCPIVRESDGLAMSSRNVHLSADERVRAASLHQALQAAHAAVVAGVDDPAAVREQALAVMGDAGIQPEYLALVAADTLAPVDRIEGDVVALVAARVGTTRLIDNQSLTAGPVANASQNGSARAAAHDAEPPAP